MKRSEMLKIIQDVYNNSSDDGSYMSETVASLILDKIEDKGMEYIDSNYEHGWKPETKSVKKGIL